MLRRILLFITLVLAMAFGSYGESHAAPVTKDRLQKVEEHKPQQQAVLTDSSNIYRICNARPQRVIPCWASETSTPNRLPLKNHFYHFLLTHQESQKYFYILS